MRVELDAGYIGTDKHYYFADGAIEAFNAGVITSPSEALELTAPRIAYSGAATGFLKGGDFSAALLVYATSGEARLELAGSIAGMTGIDLTAIDDPTSQVEIHMLGGTIVAVNGIVVKNWTSARTELTIGQPAAIKAPVGLLLAGAAGAHVVLAGSIEEFADGEGQSSLLTDGDDILELHPGYALEGTISGALGNNELQLGGTGTGTFDLATYGSFLNFDSFTKVGSSTWTLSGSIATPLDMDVQSGTVDMDGSLHGGGHFTVWDEATLTGTGTLGDVDVLDGGTLTPGSFSAGTLMAGEVVFQPGSIFEVGIGAGGAGLLDASSVSISGGTLRVVPSSAASDRYEIMRATAGIDGAFDAVVSSSPRYDVSLDTTNADATKLLIDLERTGVSFASYAKTPDQAAVAALLDAMGEAAPYYAQLDGMDPAAAAELMAQMAGAGFATTSGALLQQSSTLSGASLGRIQQQAGALGPSAGPLGYASFSTDAWYDGLHPTAWGKLIAGTSNIGGSLAGSTALVGGVDVEFGNDWTLGLLAAMGSSAISAGNASTSSADFSAGFYGAGDWGSLALRFGGSLTHHGIDSQRRVTAPGVDETLVASYGALTAQVFAELAQEFDLGPVGLELFGDLAYARHFSPGFTETGGAGALTVAASSSDAVDTTLGARVTHRVALGTRLMTVGAMVGWKHRFTAVPTTYNSFAGAAPFPVAGISTAGSALVAGANLRLDLDEWTGLDLAYALEWGSTGTAHSISAKYARMF